MFMSWLAALLLCILDGVIWPDNRANTDHSYTKYHTTWNNQNARGILESRSLHTTKDSFIQTTLVGYVLHNIQRYVRETGIECEGKVMLI